MNHFSFLANEEKSGANSIPAGQLIFIIFSASNNSLLKYCFCRRKFKIRLLNKPIFEGIVNLMTIKVGDVRYSDQRGIYSLKNKVLTGSKTTNMKRIPFLLVLLMLVFYGCQQTAEQSKAGAKGPKPIDSLFEEFYQFKLRINPIEATKAGEYAYNNKVANFIAEDYLNNIIRQYKGFHSALMQYDTTLLTDAQQMSRKVMLWDCDMKLKGLNNPITTVSSPMFDLPNFELMPLTQISSLQLYFSQVAGGQSVHPFNTVKNYDDWLSRVNEYVVFLDTAIVNMKEGMAKDIVLPRVLAKRVASQLELFISTPVDKHVFYNPINLMPKSFNAEDKERLDREFRTMITNQIIPAYTELQRFVEEEYIPACRETDGLGALPNGPETYRYLVKLHTSTDMSPDEIFNLGKKEVDRISAEMEKVKASLGFEGSLNEFFDYIRTSKEQMPYAEPEQVLEHFRKIQERIQPKLGKVFSIKPKAGFVVQRTEAFREEAAAAEYVPGTKDGSRPGTFYVPIPNANTYNNFADEALFLHEAIPGHHYQLSLQQENEKLPRFMHAEGMGVFVEGWALYSESLGRELGLYQDPVQYFGMLSMEMHRAIRLVVDAGMHAKGWTREEAIQYSLDHEAEPEANIIAEIERYMACPGQALSYKVGELTIRRLRNKAQETLGDQFNIREFHSQVLNSGSLPMDLLEQKIDKWVASKG